MKYEIEVIIGIASVNLQNSADCKILVRNYDGILALPTQILNVEKDSLEIAAQMLMDIVGLEAKIDDKGWVNLQKIGFFDKIDRCLDGVRWIALLYGAMIPEETRILDDNFVWMNISELYNEKLFMDHWGLIEEVCLRI